MNLRADTPLTTPTYDGSGQTVHPFVIDFLREHGMATWRGYRYWMGITPYPNGNASYENPSILASSDGLTWIVPSGITNPLYNTPSNGHNDDPSIAYDPVSNEIRFYWMRTQDTYNHVGVIRIPESGSPILEGFCLQQLSSVAGSAPSVWYDPSDGLWHMVHVAWVIPDEDGWFNPNDMGLSHWTSAEGLLSWTAASGIPVNCGHLDGEYYQAVPWHGTVKRLPSGSLEFLMCSYSPLYTAENGNALLSGTYAGLGEHPKFPGWIQRPDGLNAWDSAQMYHATFVVKGSQRLIWYSANNGTQWHTGYVETDPPPPLTIEDGDGNIITVTDIDDNPLTIREI